MENLNFYVYRRRGFDEVLPWQHINLGVDKQFLYNDYQNGIKMIPIFHPSYLLRNHSIESGKPRALTLSDLIKIKEHANL